MPKEKNSILQDKLLTEVRQKEISVTVFLVNGVKLQGVIVAFDDYSILLRREYTSQLVFKRAVSTIMPSNPLSLRFSNAEKSNIGNDEHMQKEVSEAEID